MNDTSPMKEFLSSLKEQLFKTGEIDHLRSMNRHSQEREKSTHADVLSQLHDCPEKNARQESAEHHGLRFWNYYFENEHPDLEQPLPDYMDNAWEENLDSSRTLSPRFTGVVPAIDGVGETEEEIKRRWLIEFTLAQVALREKNYIESEQKFKNSLEQALRLTFEGAHNRVLSAQGLADVLRLQNKFDEAVIYSDIAKSDKVQY